MADTQTITHELKIENLFLDGDTRTITLKNPKTEITAAEIGELETLIINGGTSTLLIGDATGAAFRRINTVTRVTTTRTDLDLGFV